MAVRVVVTMTLADMGTPGLNTRGLGDIIAKLREMPGVDVEISAPSPDELDRELLECERLLSSARERFKASTADIAELQARVEDARAVNTWLRRAAEA